MAKKSKWKGGSKRRRERKWKEQDKKCIYCKRTMPFKDATFDHVFPRSKSKHEDPDRDENLVVACFFCNNRRQDMPFPKFMKLIEEIKEEGKLGPTRHLDKTRLRKTKGLVKRLANMRYRPFK